jgi:autotransporter-associated beta strand protein
MKKILLLLSFCILIAISPVKTFAQLYWGGISTDTWTSAKWSSSSSGPFTSAWVSGSAVIFNEPTSGITGASVTFSSITANVDVTVIPGGTLNTGGASATIFVASGKTLDLANQAFSTAANMGYTKTGPGTLTLLATSADLVGVVNLNSGVIVCRGLNALGNGTLSLNGGTLAGSSDFDFGIRYSVINFGGDFTIGATTGLALSTANLTFASPVDLGSSTRTITLDGTGTNTFSGIITSSGGGLNIVSGSAGRLVLSGANSYSGSTIVNGGSLTLSGANTYGGSTTLSGGTLILGASEVIPNASVINLDGGTLKSGATTGFTETLSTANLSNNSTIALGTGVHSLSFERSSAVAWTAAKTLTITGWTGGYNSTTGTAGKIFFCTDALGLTTQQISQIKFFNGSVNYDATILSTGEVVPSIITVLPISLTSFTGKAVDKNILLNWATASEINNNYFEVMHSADGKTFSATGKVNGSGNSTEAKNYSFTDENPAAGTNYYKLVQHDFDGKTTSSEVVAIDSKIAAAQLAVFASSSDVKISISSPNQTKGLIQLFDIAGRKLAEQSISVSKGFNSVTLPLSLQTGIHFVRYSADGEVISQKFVR